MPAQQQVLVVAIIKSMKILVSIFLILFSKQIYAQNSAYIQYEKRSEILLEKVNAKIISDKEKVELRTIAFGFQNYGQQLDETYHDYTNSLKYINQAINLFIGLNDTLSQANNLKFKGYLLGMLNNFDEAKQEVRNAINLYESTKSLTGVAVSQFDLSRVYEQEKNLDSAIYFSNKSLNFWKSINNVWRIFNVQTMLVHLFTKSKQFENALEIQTQADLLIDSKGIRSRDLADYYILLERLYKAIGKVGEADNYKKLYKLKMEELTEQGQSFKSYYGTL